MTQLAKIAQSQPHAAYSAFNKGLASRWIYVLRTIPGIADLLQPLEDVIRFVFIPALTGRAPPNDIERNLFALPPRWGGLGLCNPVCLASHEYDASLKITEPLCKLLLSHDRQYPEVKADQLLQKSTVRSFKQQCYSRNSSDFHQQLSPSLQLAVNLATKKGASSWLTTLPLEEYGFALHKSAFQDALALRYGWLPLRTPAHCACGSSFSVDHALSCPKGGLPSIRHNEIRDLTAKLLTEVCSQVATEPELQPVSSEEFSLSTANTQDGARLDIVMNGFWGEDQSVLLLTYVFSTHLLLLTTPVLYLHVTKSMKTSRKELMVNASEKMNTPLLHLWFCPQQGALLMKPLFSTNIWLLFCPTNGEMNIHL